MKNKMVIPGLGEFAKIRYIKLGAKAAYADDCINRGIIRLGFDTGVEEVYKAAIFGNWHIVKKYWSSRCKTPQQHANQTREFFEDNGDTLWVTFHNQMLYYCIAKSGLPIVEASQIANIQHTTYKHTSSSGWIYNDINGRPLVIANLSGELTKTAGYRQTICSFSESISSYIFHKIMCLDSVDASKAKSSKNNLVADLERVIKSFTWFDFELLIELIFSNSGWRRISSTGGSQKTADIIFEDAISGDSSFVQIKSDTNQSEFRKYVEEFKKSSHKRMFYIFHTGSINSSEDGVIVWDSRQIAEKVVDVGLTNWVIDRAK